MTRHLYLAAYDVADDRRLRLSLQIIKSYATGGQKSAYECWLSERERAELLYHMAHVLEESEDRFLLISLDPRTQVQTLGKAIRPADPNYFYIQ